MLPEPPTHVAAVQSTAWQHVYMAACYTCVGVDLLDGPCILQSDFMSQQSCVLEDSSDSKLHQAKLYMTSVKPVLDANDTWTRNSSSSSSSGLSVLLTSRV